MATDRLIAISFIGIYIGVTTNSGNTYTSGSPPTGGYTVNGLYNVTFNAGNTGASTLDGHPIHKNGSALVGGELVTNGDALLRWDGTNFNLLNTGGGGGGGSNPIYFLENPTTPVTTNFTAFGSGSTITDASDRLHVLVPSGAGTQISGLSQSLPSPPWTIDGQIFLPYINQTGSASALAGIHFSDGTQYLAFYIGTNSGALEWTIDSWATVTGGVIRDVHIGTGFWQGLWFLRITNDGTTVIFWLSMDGKNFLPINSTPYSSFFTASKAGFVFINNNVGFDLRVSCNHFLISSSVLGDKA